MTNTCNIAKTCNIASYIQGNNFAINFLYACSKTQASGKWLSKSVKHKGMQKTSTKLVSRHCK